MEPRSDELDLVPDLTWASDDDVVDGDEMLCDEEAGNDVLDDDQIGMLIDDPHTYDDIESVHPSVGSVLND